MKTYAIFSVTFAGAQGNFKDIHSLHHGEQLLLAPALRCDNCCACLKPHEKFDNSAHANTGVQARECWADKSRRADAMTCFDQSRGLKIRNSLEQHGAPDALLPQKPGLRRQLFTRLKFSGHDLLREHSYQLMRQTIWAPADWRVVLHRLSIPFSMNDASVTF